MKLCKKCKAHNSDIRQYCIDCDTFLGDSISKEEELIIKNDIDKKMDKLYHRDDPLYVDKYDKVMGMISIAGVFVLILLVIIMLLTKRETEYSVIGIFAFIVAIPIALFPKLGWGIEKIRLSFIISNTDDVTPSYFYFISRKLSTLIVVIFGIVIIILSTVSLFKPPIVKYINEIAYNPEIAVYSHTKAYIDAKPNLWSEIIENENYSVSVLIRELEKASETGLREQLMIDAIIEITGINDDQIINSKEDLIFIYYTQIKN